MTTIVALFAAIAGLALYLRQEKLARLEQRLGTDRRGLEEQRRRFEDAMQDLERREQALAAREEALAVAEARSAKPRVDETSTEAAGILPNHPDVAVSLLFVAGGGGYRLLEIEPEPLRAGSVLDLEGRTYVVERLGPAPLPEDGGRCAYVEPSAARSQDPGRKP